MTPGESDSGSPKHPSSKNVDSIEGKNPHGLDPLASSKTSSGHPAKAEHATNGYDSGVDDGSSSDPENDPIYPLREGYTRKLIRMKYCPPDEFDDTFDETAWIKEAYGENIIIVDMYQVPNGWILVDGMFPQTKQKHG